MGQRSPLFILIFYQINSRSYAPTVTAAISHLKSPISIFLSRNNTTISFSDIIAHSRRPLGDSPQAGADRPISLFALGSHTHQTTKNGPFPRFSFSKFSFSFSTFRCSSHPTKTQQRTPINDTYTRDWSPEFYLFLWFNNSKSFIASVWKDRHDPLGYHTHHGHRSHEDPTAKGSKDFILFWWFYILDSRPSRDPIGVLSAGHPPNPCFPPSLFLLPVSRHSTTKQLE